MDDGWIWNQTSRILIRPELVVTVTGDYRAGVETGVDPEPPTLFPLGFRGVFRQDVPARLRQIREASFSLPLPVRSRPFGSGTPGGTGGTHAANVSSKRPMGVLFKGLLWGGRWNRRGSASTGGFNLAGWNETVGVLEQEFWFCWYRVGTPPVAVLTAVLIGSPL